MKYALLLLLLPITLIAQHRTVGKTIFYDKPNGQAIFYLIDDVSVNVYDGDTNEVSLKEKANGWKEVYPSHIYLLKANIKKKVLKMGSKILNKKHKEIGRTLKDINLSDFIDSTIKYGDTMDIHIHGFSKMTTVRELTYNELLRREEVHFATQNPSNFIVFGDTGSQNEIHYKSNENSFKIIREFSDTDDRDTYMLLKTSIYTDSYLGWDWRDTRHNISVTVYPNIFKKDSFIFLRKDVHNIKLVDDYKDFRYWEITTYGCCMDPTKYELVKFPSNQTLFTCDRGYYDISFAGINDFILFGFKTKRGEGKNENLVGELGYTINGEKNGKVVFRTKRKEDAFTIPGEDIGINFIQIDTTDRIFGWENSCKTICYDWYNQDYNYYSVDKSNLKENKFKSVYEASGIGVELTFEAWINGNKVIRKAKVVFDKGEVKNKEIFLDFD